MPPIRAETVFYGDFCVSLECGSGLSWGYRTRISTEPKAVENHKSKLKNN